MHCQGAQASTSGETFARVSLCFAEPDCCGCCWPIAVSMAPVSVFDEFSRPACLAPGRHTGSVKVTPKGELLLNLTWPEPYGGTGKERYYLYDQDTLVVETSLTVGGRTVEYKNWHKRRDESPVADS